MLRGGPVGWWKHCAGQLRRPSARSLVTMTHVSGTRSILRRNCVERRCDQSGSAIPLWHHGQRGSSLRRESPPSRSVADPAPPARSHTRTSPATRGPGAHAPSFRTGDYRDAKGFPGAAASQHACHPASEPSPTGTPGRRCHAPAASPPSHPTRSWSPSPPTVSGPGGRRRPAENAETAPHQRGTSMAQAAATLTAPAIRHAPTNAAHPTALSCAVRSQ